MLGQSFAVDAQWSNRLVRVEIDVDAGRMRFFALRRREPTVQPMLKELVHHIPRRRFNE